MHSESPATPRERIHETLFPAAGEMGPLCREKDWAASPLGPVEEWPESLRTAAGLVLRQGIAMNLCWGPDLLQIYNDSYRVIMGDKHPAGLGRSVLWSWAEISGEIAPLFERVFQGETVYFEDLRLRVERHGVVEDAYFTFSYSPIVVESGAVGAALINCYETTRQVRARALQAERDRLFEELRVERARLEYVFQRAPAFLAVVRGPDHVFELANEAYYRVVGHRELLGKPVREALPEVVEQGFVALLDHVLESGEPHIGREVPVQLARSPGGEPEERYLDFSYIPLLEADGTRSGIIAHGTDVTDQVMARREVERLLRESERARAESEAARAEAETANRAKADFLASMSHELRTPLNAIGGYVDLVDMGIHGSVTRAQKAALARVKASQQHLLMLINDVLAFAKVEAGQIEMDVQPLDAREMLTSVEPLVAPLAEAKRIDLSIEECDPSLRVLADRERARQIVLNLVANAIKFTPAGGWIRLGCERDGGRVAIRVHDNGPGIAPEKQQTIFDPFFQVDRRLSNPREGVGLGLAISRDLARAMGGELDVTSVPGEGSTFTLRLPAEK
jgi:signal transduction histidine kinase